jgi:2-amino-4-hydroxy-6-hydroxymethyldihydropteridine diphosphokinase
MEPRDKNIGSALCRLNEFLADLIVSPLYETEALVVTDQPQFLNLVLKAGTSYSPRKLLETIKTIEIGLGRNRASEIPYGPRPIDIDILLYDNKIIHSDDLHIPHPEMKKRKFVLLPLTDIEPDIRDPESGEKFSTFLSSLQGQGIYSYTSDEYNGYLDKLHIRPVKT